MKLKTLGFSDEAFSKLYPCNREGEKGARTPGAVPSAGAESPATKPPLMNTVLVVGTQITEEVIRRRLVSHEPFTYLQDANDEEK